MPPTAQPLAGAVIAFDLDGTLVDSAPDLVGTLNHLLGEEGIAPLPFDQGRSLIGHGARRLIQRGFEVHGLAVEGADLEALFERFIDHY
ncbi:MAG: HAD hydrolase-like protein, partial [Phenylobacterium sp.]|nr:HAD hydrolase-like protein [Phenylobacterium sp.]